MSGTYPEDWARIARAVKSAAGWRCERCGVKHEVRCPYCHGTESISRFLLAPCPACDGKGQRGRVLTVHHLDGDKSNSARWNLAALCQRCHLSIQARVDWHQGYLYEHSPWMQRHVEMYETAMTRDIRVHPPSSAVPGSGE